MWVSRIVTGKRFTEKLNFPSSFVTVPVFPGSNDRLTELTGIPVLASVTVPLMVLCPDNKSADARNKIRKYKKRFIGIEVKSVALRTPGDFRIKGNAYFQRMRCHGVA
jgi:hypothetical protein